MQYSDPETELLHTIVHQLKTPINAVRGCLELVQNMGPLNERQAHFTDRALVGLDKMEHLISKLLDITWLDSGMQLDLVECDLGALIRDSVQALEEIASKRQIAIQVDIDDRLGLIVADAERLTLVVDNLVSNAVKYNRDGGTMWVKAAGEPNYVEVSIRDTGIGIPSEDMDRVFDRFFRSRLGVEQKIEGSGLGLAIVQTIIQEHQGRIWVESEENEGTTFTFVLPRKLEFSEGSDSTIELIRPAGEGEEDDTQNFVERASESSDAVNDDIQESREESLEEDSHGDAV